MKFFLFIFLLYIIVVVVAICFFFHFVVSHKMQSIICFYSERNLHLLNTAQYDEIKQLVAVQLTKRDAQILFEKEMHGIYRIYP